MSANFQLQCDAEIEKIKSERDAPTLLLHSCCGPCSSYVLEYLSEYFKITVLFFNPNIYPESEFQRRLKTQEKLIKKLPVKNFVDFMYIGYEYKVFSEKIRGLEGEREGGLRCAKCFELRLRKTAELAKEYGFDYFTTTLTVSPHKDAGLLNELGSRLGEEFKVQFLKSDFKKREGYKRSIELSKEYGLYRQDYCGCEFSLVQS